MALPIVPGPSQSLCTGPAPEQWVALSGETQAKPGATWTLEAQGPILYAPCPVSIDSPKILAHGGLAI